VVFFLLISPPTPAGISLVTLPTPTTCVSLLILLDLCKLEITLWERQSGPPQTVRLMKLSVRLADGGYWLNGMGFGWRYYI